MNSAKLNPKVISFTVLVFVITIDQLTKHLAPSSMIHYNEGLIFGSFTELPSTVRVLTLCSLGGLFMTAYFFLTYVLSKTLKWLHLGLALLIGGVMGNILDRALLGKTIDFIPLGLDSTMIVFNLADVFQWIGALIIAYKVITKEKIIWYPENQRGQFLVLKRDQIYFATKVTIFCFCAGLLISLFSLTYFRLSLASLPINEGLLNSYIANLALGVGALTLVFCVLAFSLSLYLSHKMAGPLYAFEIFVEELLEGKQRTFKLREGDRAQHLVKVGNELAKHFGQSHRQE